MQQILWETADNEILVQKCDARTVSAQKIRQHFALCALLGLVQRRNGLPLQLKQWLEDFEGVTKKNDSDPG